MLNEGSNRYFHRPVGVNWIDRFSIQEAVDDHAKRLAYVENDASARKTKREPYRRRQQGFGTAGQLFEVRNLGAGGASYQDRTNIFLLLGGLRRKNRKGSLR